MKIKSKRRFKPKKVTNERNSYPNYISSVNSVNFYQHKRGYRIYSKYNYYNNYDKKLVRNDKHRPVSPTLGSEEYMIKKIQQTSANIMKQLLNPDLQSVENVEGFKNPNKQEYTLSTYPGNNACESHSCLNNFNKTKPKKDAYNIDEIQDKIMNHIMNLNDGKKKNLINCNVSGYDAAIDQIQKKKRLEISRALRVMCSQPNNAQESSDFLNSIIPDIGIKIEDLPHHLIEELRNTLNLSQFSLEADQTYGESCSNASNNTSFQMEDNEIYIKHEATQTQSETRSKMGDDKLFGDLENVTDTINIKNEICEQSVSENSADPIAPEKAETYEENPSNASNIMFQKEHNVIYIEPEVTQSQSTIPSKRGDNELFRDLEKIKDTVNIKREICEDPVSESFTDSTAQESIQPDLKTECIEDEFTQQNRENITYVEFNKVGKGVGRISNREKDLYITEYGAEIIEKSENLCLSPLCKKKFKSTSNISTQTDEILYSQSSVSVIDYIINSCFNRTSKNVSEVVRQMFEIDQCISRLTNYRQTLYTCLNTVDEFPNLEQTIENIEVPVKLIEKDCNIMVCEKKNTKNKKYKLQSLAKKSTEVIEIDAKQTTPSNNDNLETYFTVCEGKCLSTSKKRKTDLSTFNESKDIVDEDCIINESSLECKENEGDLPPQCLEFMNLNEKILVIKVSGDKLVAGTESGKIIFCDLKMAQYSRILNISHLPITSVLFTQYNSNTIHMYVGSFDTTLKIYNLHDYSVFENITLLGDGIQCMDCNWGYVFIGGVRGSLFRYKMKKKAVEYEEKISTTSILVLKATQEGARKVLLIGSRNTPVCIRDAMTGLYMRTMENVVSPTVYSLIMEKSLVYCGTTNHDILVYSFHDGKLIHRHKATDSKGIGCMKIDKNLLFASCYNGNIYVYDIRKNIYIGTIDCPGGVILAMEIYENQVIIGTMSFKFMTLPIPLNILSHRF